MDRVELRNLHATGMLWERQMTLIGSPTSCIAPCRRSIDTRDGVAARGTEAEQLRATRPIAMVVKESSRLAKFHQ